MLILLPFATFIFLFLSLLGFEYTTGSVTVSVRGVFLKTATFLGAYTVLFSELLSLFSALNTLWVSIFWSFAIIVCACVGWYKGWLAQGIIALRSKWQKPDLFDWIAGTILAIILALLFVVAVKSPPNNNDSLLYHMSRVAHWIQNGSLRHYATQYLHQVILPPGAEILILNTSLLWGNFKLVNLIQYGSLLGVLIGVAAMAKSLGADKTSQWLVIAFTISLPIGILQSTSTQNDYVTAFWYVCFLYLTFNFLLTQNSKINLITVGLSLGMGMLTKSIFYPFAFPVIIFLALKLIKTRKFQETLIKLIVIGSIAFLLNTGIWVRNIISFGTPLGPKEFVSNNTNHVFDPGVMTAGVIRNITQNFVTPEDTINNEIVIGLKTMLLPIDPGMERFTLQWAWNHEDLAGNPIQVLFILLSIAIIGIYHRRIKEKMIWQYLIILVCAYFMLPLIVRYELFGIRYQLPILVAFAPIIGISIGLLEVRRLIPILTILLLLSTFPWVLFNRTRPLIAMRPSNDPFTIPCYAGCTTGSILNEPPESTMFAVWADRKDSYINSMKLVKSLDCKDIGLKLDSSDLEYVYWWLLDAPQSGRRLESIETIPELERYLDPNFKPCAIICTTCGKDQTTLKGLDLLSEFQRIKIYSSVK